MGRSRSVRKAARRRYGNICAQCGETDQPTEVHHWIPVSLAPDLEREIENCQILCTACHKYVHDEFYALVSLGDELAPDLGTHLPVVLQAGSDTFCVGITLPAD